MWLSHKIYFHSILSSFNSCYPITNVRSLKNCWPCGHKSSFRPLIRNFITCNYILHRVFSALNRNTYSQKRPKSSRFFPSKYPLNTRKYFVVLNFPTSSLKTPVHMQLQFLQVRRFKSQENPNFPDDLVLVAKFFKVYPDQKIPK